jgi:hypothetical protein
LWTDLARLCGRREAFSLLERFSPQYQQFYETMQYELALLKYAKSCPIAEIKGFIDIKNVSPRVKRM